MNNEPKHDGDRRATKRVREIAITVTAYTLGIALWCLLALLGWKLR